MLLINITKNYPIIQIAAKIEQNGVFKFKQNTKRKDRTEWRKKDTILKWQKREFKKDKSLRKFKFMQYFQSKLLAIIRQIIIINNQLKTKLTFKHLFSK